ncbi:MULTISPECIES: thioredoxin family protein [Chryseobacterium]|jgi:thioredoxin-related protein|uniref:Thioredoxin family protein n=1 Tax=Chryseobacterium piscium TaxID=333702 RepID=A0A3D9BLW6_9FLAO|nr:MULTISPECIES: thioredoxin family protein [Chryseobacterium]REC43639.1 thioredoxin family protein [Chryseobacterium sp. 5_R23647]REC54436.1 thioredoxin family protein [Chryseobacterium piscium]
MKKMSLVALLALSTLAWAQKIEKPTKVKNSSDKALLVKSDAAELEAKKKAAAEEKAKLPKPYDPKADAQADINKLVAQAKKEGKNIMIQAGGNWCIWCLRFNQYVQTTPELKKMVDKNYLYYHLNYSPDNKNEKVFSQYGNPGEKFGYPVFIVLDKNGKMIHIQQSDVLEDGKGYSLEKTKEFFNQWAPKS